MKVEKNDEEYRNDLGKRPWCGDWVLIVHRTYHGRMIQVKVQIQIGAVVVSVLASYYQGREFILGRWLALFTAA